MTADQRRDVYVASLRRIAHLTETGVLPMPIGNVMVSFWFHENEDGRQHAAVAAEALGCEWRPGTVSDSRYLRAVATPGDGVPLEMSLYLDTGKVESDPPSPPPASVAFAAEMNAAAGVVQ